MPARPHIGTLLQDLSPRREDLEREGASGVSDDWQPRRRFTGNGEFHGSNVYLGSIDGLLSELREAILGSEHALAFAAEAGGRYRRIKRARILAYARAIGRQPGGGPAAPRKLQAECQIAQLKASESDAELAFELAKLACKTMAEDKSAVQTASRLVMKQIDMDQGKNEQAGYNRREMARTAGRRQGG